MIYRIVRDIISVYLKLFNKIDVEGAENIPQEGAVVLVANHVSQWDPLVLGGLVKRAIHFMAKEEVFSIPLLGKLVPYLGAFPVKRGKADRNALKMAAKYLQEGEILGLFPEGTRSKGGSLLPFQPGAALFALRSSAPIVPVGLIGTKTTFPLTLRGRIKVIIGEPLIYPELYSGKIREEDLTRVTEDVKGRIEEILGLR